MTLIFCAAILGALARETFRWRTLYLSGRLDLYLKPLYIGIALTIVIMAGLVALIFAPLLPSGAPQNAAAFVFGAGFELVVRAAARLRMPKVPMGGPAEARSPGSVDEFLRI